MFIKVPLSVLLHVMKNGDEKFLKKTKTFGTFSVKKDLSYIDDGSEFHKLDVLAPVLNHENGIVLFYIHGGAYVHGMKEHSRPFTSWFVSKGFTVIAINYRLIDKKGTLSVIDQLQDVIAALQYISDNRHNLNLNMDKFCLLGDSAGGHLCLLTDMIYRSKELQEYMNIKELPPVKIRCLGLDSTMYDYEKLRQNSRKYLTNHGNIHLFSNKLDDPSYLKGVSPKTYLTSGVKLSPVFNSTAYNDFFKEQSYLFKRDCEKHGVDLTFYFEPSLDKKIGHVFNHFNFDNEGLNCNMALCDFFKKYC